MPYSIDPLTADCYDGTACLINKFNIRDSSQLSEIEARITFARASELEQHPISGAFDFANHKESDSCIICYSVRPEASFR